MDAHAGFYTVTLATLSPGVGDSLLVCCGVAADTGTDAWREDALCMFIAPRGIRA